MGEELGKLIHGEFVNVFLPWSIFRVHNPHNRRLGGAGYEKADDLVERLTQDGILGERGFIVWLINQANRR